MRHTMDWITLVLAALTTARITRFITTDYLAGDVRRWLLNKLDGHDKLQYLIICSWCTSIYIAAAVAAYGATAGWWTWHLAPLIAMAFSYTSGWLASKEGDA